MPVGVWRLRQLANRDHPFSTRLDAVITCMKNQLCWGNVTTGRANKLQLKGRFTYLPAGESGIFSLCNSFVMSSGGAKWSVLMLPLSCVQRMKQVSYLGKRFCPIHNSFGTGRVSFLSRVVRLFGLLGWLFLSYSSCSSDIMAFGS